MSEDNRLTLANGIAEQRARAERAEAALANDAAELASWREGGVLIQNLHEMEKRHAAALAGAREEERERCARAAETATIDLIIHHGGEITRKTINAREKIAAAIRALPTPSDERGSEGT